MDKKYFEVDSLKPFSQSLIWQMNRTFYQDKGIDAWSKELVPHHMTSNSRVGKTYAELILGILEDRSNQGANKEVVYILELGAGHGRLAFHILKHLEKLVESSSQKLPSYCYVLSDIAEKNLSFFKDHTQLNYFVEKGRLDFCYFDAIGSDTIDLRVAKKKIIKNDLAQPLIAIANYFFDSIPTDVFLVQNGRMAECKVAIHSEEDPNLIDNDTLIKSLNLSYEKRELRHQVYNDPIHNDILNNYKSMLVHSHIYFPEKGMKCIENLNNFSKEGLMLLSMDKGFHAASDLDKQGEPDLVSHGSLSIWVNYHALGDYCVRIGGKSMFPTSATFNMDIACFLIVKDVEQYKNTQFSFEQHVNDFGPDDFNSLKKMSYFNINQLTTKELIAFFRLGAYDSTYFINLLPRLKQVIAEISYKERTRVKEALHKVWDMYFNINESFDLAYEMAGLLYDLGYYQDALHFFQHSTDIFGAKADNFYNKILCYYQLREDELFYQTLSEAKIAFPQNPIFDSLDKLDMSSN